jgi:hemerythrin superfamily protein
VPTKSATRSSSRPAKQTKKVAKKAAKASARKTTKPAKQAAKRANARKAPAKKATSPTRARRPDAIALLKADHREVEQLFKRFEKAGDSAEREKRRIVDSITRALSEHAAIEEQVLYPWARENVSGIDDEVLEAYEEHRIVKWLLTELRSLPPADERFDAKVTVMIELVRHHVKEEESDLFPDLRDAANRTQLLDLGDRLRTAKRGAPTVPDLGPTAMVGAAVEHARNVGKDVVDRIGALTGVE